MGMVYRPFYERIASLYREAMVHRSVDGLPTQDFDSSFTFNTILHGMLVWDVYQAYRAHFRNIKIYSLDDNLVSSIICDDLGAARVCKEIRDRRFRRHLVRHSDNFNGRCLDKIRLDLLLNRSLVEHANFIESGMIRTESDSWKLAFR